MGESGDPCGIPVVVSYSFDLYPSTRMLVRLPDRKLAIHVTVFSLTLRL